MDCRNLAESSKETSSPSSEPEALPPSVGQRAGAAPGRPAAANAARERSRVQTLRQAFLELQKTLPSVPPDTKLSKLDTLRLASSYIAHLRQLLQEDRYENGYVHPVNLVRPRGARMGGGGTEPVALRLGQPSRKTRGPPATLSERGRFGAGGRRVCVLRAVGAGSPNETNSSGIRQI